LGHGLVGEQHRDVEELVDGVGANHAHLSEQRVDGHVHAREGARVRARGARAGLGAAALHDDDGLLARDLGEARP
jgi:hypothetical protein